jgi:hypothetical protein
MPALSLAVLLLLLCPSRASTEAVPFHVIQNIMQGNDIRFVPVDEHIHLDPETFKRDYASQGRPGVLCCSPFSLIFTFPQLSFGVRRPAGRQSGSGAWQACPIGLAPRFATGSQMKERPSLMSMVGFHCLVFFVTPLD